MSIDTKRLSGKNCFVTGSVGSIGFDVSRRYGEYGANVFMFDKDPDIVKSAELLRTQGFSATGIELDLTNHGTVIHCFKELIEHNGPVFSLVNCVGMTNIMPFEKTPPGLWKKMIETNLFCTVNCIQGVIASMREQREGKIILMASKAGRTGSKYMTVYGAAKGAIVTLTQALAQEYAAYNINVNCICPDIVDESGMWINVVSEQYSETLNVDKDAVRELYEGKVPLGRFATKEDISDMIVFYTISADDCTGQSINITGGRFMH
jgi:NAD(P)-dependent dehydrogenase (short-subunit alcohol dehydrogenase family)